MGYLEQKTKQYAHKMNEEMPFITMKELKSRYGSCSSLRQISYAAKLVFAQKEVIDYVCVHEVAHLQEMNHFDRFVTFGFVESTSTTKSTRLLVCVILYSKHCQVAVSLIHQLCI